MSFTVVYTMKCDDCGWWDERTQSNKNRADAVTKGRAIGWDCSDGVQLCAACAAERKTA